MELLMISFAAAWIARGFMDGRRADYRSPDNGYQRNVVARGGTEPQHRMSGPDARYAVGWSAHQLRHGWPQMIADVRQGWGDARQAYEEWRASRGNQNTDSDTDGESPKKPRRPRFTDAWRTGWRKARRDLPKAWWKKTRSSDTEQPKDRGDTTNPAPANTDSSTSIPFSTAPNGAAPMTTPTTGEASGITPYRAHLNSTKTFAEQRIEAAQAEIQLAEQEIASHDNVHAGLSASGMGGETTGEIAGMVEAAMARKAAAEGKLAAAEAEKARAEKALSDLDVQGHTNVEESVKGASAPVAATTFYEN